MTPVISFDDVLAIEAQSQPDDLPPSTYALIQRSAAAWPDAPALSFFPTVDSYQTPEVWTYREFLQAVIRAANAFRSLGIERDDVVAYVLPNLPETHFTMWGGEATGIVAAFNPMLETASLSSLLAEVRAKVLVTLAPFPGTDIWQRVQPALRQAKNLEHVIFVSLADHAPGPAGSAMRQAENAEIERLHGEDGIAAALPEGVQLHTFSELMAAQDGEEWRFAEEISPNDISSLFCTGGTTGHPKIAIRRHGNEVANAWSLGQFTGDAIGSGTALFCGLPLFHVNGVMVTGLLPFSKGAHVVLGTPQGYRAEGLVRHFWEIVEHYRINLFSAVPTLYAALMQVPVGGLDISSLKYGICGAAPLPVEVFHAFEQRTGLRILEGYGLTEGACVSSLNPLGESRRPGSIGFRLPGQLMKAVVVDEAGQYLRDCKADEPGVIIISGPNVFSGYLNPTHNQGIWLDCGDQRRWLNTGDLGRQDGNGFFWLTGRKKELIIRGGHNIDPILIEDALHSHPAVALAAAVARPDSYAGELPVAYVTLKTGCVVSEAELASHVRDRITERAAIPKYIRIVETMPVTAVGKIFKPALYQQEVESAVFDALMKSSVEVLSVMVSNHISNGLNVDVTVASHHDVARADSALGQFPFLSSVRSSGI